MKVSLMTTRQHFLGLMTSPCNTRSQSLTDSCMNIILPGIFTETQINKPFSYELGSYVSAGTDSNHL